MRVDEVDALRVRDDAVGAPLGILMAQAVFRDVGDGHGGIG